MNDFLFNKLRQLDKYDTLANRSTNRDRTSASRSGGPTGIGGGPRPQPSLQRPTAPALGGAQNPMLNFDEWVHSQPYGGQVSPFQPQGQDYWEEQYNDYVAGWNSKFGPQGNIGGNQGFGSQSQMRQPGSGGSRDMGTPSLGNLLTGRPNKSY